MVKDYSGGCIAINSRNRKMKSASFRVRDFSPAAKFTWKALGGVLFVTVIIGITSTVWYGWQIQNALDQIGKDLISHSELSNENNFLVVKKNILLTQEHMEEAAQKIGLSAPKKDQLRYP